MRDSEREWKLELDVDYVDWTSFKNLDVKLSNGITLPLPQNWSATYVLMFGTEYKWLVPPGLPGWEIAARGGYIHSATPVPTKTFGAAIPDADYNAFSIGLGLLCRPLAACWFLLTCGSEQGPWWTPKAIGLDLAYQYLLYGTRQISNADDPRVNGGWHTTTHVGSISLRVNFDTGTPTPGWGTSQESGTEISEFAAGRPYFHADIQTTGPWAPSAQAQGSIPNYEAIQMILSMPVVGRSPSGSLVCSYFELNYNNATVAPVQSNHEFLQPFKPGMEGWVALGALSSSGRTERSRSAT